MTLLTGEPVVVIDDDPTGSQLSGNVGIALRQDALERALELGHGVAHAVTNSRAYAGGEAAAAVEEVAREALRVAPDAAIVLRGDSTLRGWVKEEARALSAVVFGEGTPPVQLVVPALPQAGRVTVDGIHYLVTDGDRHPVAGTDYARDPRFSFSSSRLLGWAEERSAGFFASSVGREVHLAALRESGGDAVVDALAERCRAGVPAVVAVDAETADDVRLAASGFRKAQTSGLPVIARGSPAFAAAFAGRESASPVQLSPFEGGVLLLSGSWVDLTRRQLAALDQIGVDVIELPLAELLRRRPDGATVADLRDRLRRDRLAVITTPPFSSMHAGAAAGMRIASVLARLASELVSETELVITKGGITSATVAATLSDGCARAVGPVRTGVGAWELETAGRRIDQLVVPGNVGSVDLLVDLLRDLNPQLV